MDFEVITLFPDLVTDAARYGVTGRALERGLWQLRCHNPRDCTHDAYRRVDDRPFGGGPGMVMLAEPLWPVCAVCMRCEPRKRGLRLGSSTSARGGRH